MLRGEKLAVNGGRRNYKFSNLPGIFLKKVTGARIHDAWNEMRLSVRRRN